MNKENNKALYDSPEMKIYELNVQQVICTSDSGNGQIPTLTNDSDIYGF